MTNDRPGLPPSEFFRKLRARPLSSWTPAGSTRDRQAAARAAANRMAELAWARDHHDRPVPPVPDLGWFALADQLEVLWLDAQRAGVNSAELDRLLLELADQLSVRLQ